MIRSQDIVSVSFLVTNLRNFSAKKYKLFLIENCGDYCLQAHVFFYRRVQFGPVLHLYLQTYSDPASGSDVILHRHLQLQQYMVSQKQIMPVNFSMSKSATFLYFFLYFCTCTYFGSKIDKYLVLLYLFLKSASGISLYHVWQWIARENDSCCWSNRWTGSNSPE